MKTKNSYNYRVDLSNLFWEIIYRWKLILLVGILFSVLVSLAPIGHNTDEKPEEESLATHNENQSIDSRIASLKSKMITGEIVDAETMYHYTLEMVGLQKYRDNSLYMTVDPYHVIKVSYIYKMKSIGDSEDLEENILNYVKSNAFLKKIAIELGLDYEQTYFDELINVSLIDGCVDIEVLLPHDISEEDVTNAIGKAVSEDDHINSKLELSDVFITNTKDDNIRKRQSEVYVEIFDKQNGIDSIHAGADNNTEELFALLMEKEGLMESGSSEEPTEDEQENDRFYKSRIQNAVIGFFVGFLLCVCGVGIYVVNDGKITSVICGGVFDEYAYLGTVRRDNKSTNWLLRSECFRKMRVKLEQQQYFDVEAMAGLIAFMNNADDIAIISLDRRGDCSGSLDAIINTYNRDTGKDGSIIEPLLYDEKGEVYRSIECINTSTVLCVGLNNSRLEELEIICSYLKMRDTKVIGIIGVE